MRHYYNDDGELNYAADPELLIRLKQVLPDVPRVELRHAVLTFASELLLDYQLYNAVVAHVQSAWQQVIQELFVNFVAEGYVPGEFILVAWYSTFRAQSEILL